MTRILVSYHRCFNTSVRHAANEWKELIHLWPLQLLPDQWRNLYFFYFIGLIDDLIRDWYCHCWRTEIIAILPWIIKIHSLYRWHTRDHHLARSNRNPNSIFYFPSHFSFQFYGSPTQPCCGAAATTGCPRRPATTPRHRRTRRPGSTSVWPGCSLGLHSAVPTILRGHHRSAVRAVLSSGGWTPAATLASFREEQILIWIWLGSRKKALDGAPLIT